MKKGFILLFLLISVTVLKAQDTTVIQTLTFSDINKRSGTYVFPDSTHDWRKIILSYTLKCDAATTWDQYPCGEWDYLTYAFVHQHTGLFDSSALTHPWFKVGTLAPSSIDLITTPINNIYHTNQYQMVYDAINSESDFVVGTGATTSDFPFTASKNTQRAQFLYKASELTASGLTAGAINRLRLDVSSLGTSFTNFRVRIKQVSSTSITTFDNGSGWTSVFYSSLNFSSTGMNSIDFTAPFTWNGTSNLIVEFSYENTSVGTNHTVASDVLSYNAGVISDTTSQQYLDFTGNRYVDVSNGGFGNITDEVTISFWMYGDAAFQPEDGTIFEGVNASNQRVLNSHLPWSNGNVYWDAGVDETGSYDRISKLANATDYEGKWNHWAFTKNAVTGSMKIYLNGALWHSGTGMTKSMAGMDEFKIGANFFSTYGYHGKVDEFCIFNKELSLTEISSWMNKYIDASHTSYGNLLYYFSFEENGGNICQNEVNASLPAYLMGMPTRKKYDGTELSQINQVTTHRPKTVFVRGNYTSHLDTLVVTETIPQEETSIAFYQVNGNGVEVYDSVFGWVPGYSYEYTNGVKSDSTLISGGTTYTNSTLNYFGPPFEVLEDMEIGRFITPYGINLDLGPNGFEWRYDVTDYAHLFHDSVELSAGNTQELIDMKFIMIEGTPPAEVVKIDQLWNTGVASYSYANLDNDVNLSLDTTILDPATSEVKLKTRLTGHGHNSNSGNYPHCCEWKDNTHYMNVNSGNMLNWHIWRDDCAENPVFPQGGTWPGQREGWCPGDVVLENEFRLTDYIPNGMVSLDYDITPVPSGNLGMGGGNYVTAMHLIEYGAPNFSLDAEIYDVIRPNDWEYQRRKNPICYGPKVIIRNNGSTTLASCTIQYQVSGGTMSSYVWNGNLKFMEKAEVTLPVTSGVFWVGDGSNNFTATIVSPNGGTDGYADNDSYTTHFNLPDMYADNFMIQMKTNNNPTENSWTVKDVNGNIVASRNGVTANFTYKDTLELSAGCYTFEIQDAGEDGLNYWANTAQGSGNLRFYNKTTGTLMKNFGTDFGKSIHYAFVIGDITHVQETGTDVYAEAFPNPTNGKVNVVTKGFIGNSVLEYFDQTGKMMGTVSFNAEENQQLTLDLSSLANGIYFYSIRSENNFFTGKIILQK